LLRLHFLQLQMKTAEGRRKSHFYGTPILADVFRPAPRRSLKKAGGYEMLHAVWPNRQSIVMLFRYRSG